MFKIFAALMAVPVLCVLLAGAAIYRSGVMIVDVENKISGRRLFVPVPMMLVNLAATMNSRPAQNIRQNMAPLQKANLHGAFQALAQCPDTTFVEVQKTDTTLVVRKNGRMLSIHAESEEQRLDIRVPIESAERALTKLSAEH
jgi:hypothetical protein